MKAMYEPAIELARLEPWEFMQEEEAWVFKIRGQTFYAMITGAEGLSRALVMYRGERGYKLWRHALLGIEVVEEDIVQRLDCLNVDFDLWRALSPGDKRRLERMGYRSGPGYWPWMTSYRPGRLPAWPDAEETAQLIAALRATLTIAMDIEDGDDVLARPGSSDLLTVFTVDDDGEIVNMEWLPHPDVSNPPQHSQSSPLDEIGLRRLGNLRLSEDPAWEILTGTVAIGIKDASGEGGFIPLMAFFVREDSGFVTGVFPAPAEEMSHTLSSEILAAMERHRVRPRAFRVSQEDVEAWIRPLAEALDIQIERAERLPMAAEALNFFRESVRNGDFEKFRREGGGGD